MRIISGLLKGKKIFEPNDIKTRPLKDLTKESIFNIISHSKKFEINLNKAIVLDLFSGVGSFGIECLSRGVEKVIFVENYEGVIPVLKKNLDNLKININFEIIKKDIYKNETILDLKSKFDIIFLDPPYKDKNIEKILSNIIINKSLKNNGIIIMHRHKNEKDKFLEKFQIVEEKKYGISKVIFFKLLD